MHDSPAPQRFTLRTPYMESGVGGDHFLATSGLLNVGVKVYAAGGENLLHNHPKEDHAFVVLEGRARFEFGYDEALEIGPLEGVLLPRGANYCFANVSGGDANLVMIRVGAALPGDQYTPVYADGSVKGADTEPNSRMERVARPGPGFGR